MAKAVNRQHENFQPSTFSLQQKGDPMTKTTPKQATTNCSLKPQKHEKHRVSPNYRQFLLKLFQWNRFCFLELKIG
jgi:hypothetical protein